MKIFDLSGIWQCGIPGICAPLQLPGTLDESCIGHPDACVKAWHPESKVNEEMAGLNVIATRFTRKYTYVGPARITRRISCSLPEGKRLFLRVERARHLKLEVNGKPVPDMIPPTLATARCFEVTGLITGEDTITWISDNSYPGWPEEDITYSSAATDETQTNWNGLLGELGLYAEEPAFLSAVRVYPHGDTVDVQAVVDGDLTGDLCLTCDAFAEPSLTAQPVEGWIRGIPLREDAKRWDLEEGNLYTLTVTGDKLEAKAVTFGLRDFRAENGCFTLNGRRIFLRSEANCAEFPETGYEPMTTEAWKSILETYRSYGVNMLRFHSHVPPEAAFRAADELGMLLQPELNCWDPRHAMETPIQADYYTGELRQTLLALANHPSFVMLTLGNELHADSIGHTHMSEMLAMAKALDDTRLYANGSNVHYGVLGADPDSDFYTSNAWHELMIRATSAGMKGYLNEDIPSAAHSYDDEMSEIRKTWDKPVFSFEVGQYEVLPDFRELEDFHGISRPDNLTLIRNRVREKGMEADWEQRVSATGELSLLCYREEVEAALRTRDFSGISLLGLQDFPGQGTALVGMLNSHLQPKPYPFAQPERFRAFFRDVLPMALPEKYTWESGEELRIPLKLANYGRTDLTGACCWSLGVAFGEEPACTVPQGTLGDIGEITLTVPEMKECVPLTLTLSFAGHSNSYPIWFYPTAKAVCPEDVHVCAELDTQALKALASGGKVYLNTTGSVRTQFSTDFWSVGTFPEQSGTMGQLIDTAHPIFREFPTSFHSDWQWHTMAGQGAMLLPPEIRCIITELDSYAYLRPLGQLFECRCRGGSLMVSCLNLDRMQHLPECRALQRAIFRYMASDDFAPSQEVGFEVINGIVAAGEA